MKILAKFQKDWADEHDVYGFRVFDSIEDFNEYVAGLADESFGFGTNEGWETGEIDKNDFETIEISDEAASFLKTHFGKEWRKVTEWGFFPG